MCPASLAAHLRSAFSRPASDSVTQSQGFIFVEATPFGYDSGP
jgi:hypothetical protein